MDSTDNSNDDNDLEVAAVLASALKENAFCQQTLSSQSNPNPPRSSTVLTNLPRGNSVNLSHSSDTFSPTVYELAAKGEFSTLKRVLQHLESGKLKTDGKIPLLVASRNNWPQIVQFLLEQGESVNASGEGKTTALHQASAEGNAKIVEILLKFNPDINSQCSRGNTPLHYAIHSKECTCISLLLQAGADVTLANVDGLTPIEFAYKQNCKDVEYEFRKHLLSLFE